LAVGDAKQRQHSHHKKRNRFTIHGLHLRLFQIYCKAMGFASWVQSVAREILSRDGTGWAISIKG
jgi:hypothetical protein